MLRCVRRSSSQVDLFCWITTIFPTTKIIVQSYLKPFSFSVSWYKMITCANWGLTWHKLLLGLFVKKMRKLFSKGSVKIYLIRYYCKLFCSWIYCIFHKLFKNCNHTQEHIIQKANKLTYYFLCFWCEYRVWIFLRYGKYGREGRVIGSPLSFF